MSGPPPLTERIRQVERRLHIVSALTTAVEAPVATMVLLAGSEDLDEAHAVLQERFAFDAVQASAVMDMQLRQTPGHQRTRIAQERDNLLETLAALRRARARQHAVAAQRRAGRQRRGGEAYRPLR